MKFDSLETSELRIPSALPPSAAPIQILGTCSAISIAVSVPIRCVSSIASSVRLSSLSLDTYPYSVVQVLAY